MNSKSLTNRTFWLASGDIASKGLNFIAAIYVARVLGDELFGVIIFGISVLGYASWTSEMGLAHIGVREMAKDKESRRFRPREILGLKFILAILVVIAFAAVIWFIPMEAFKKKILLTYLLTVLPSSLMLEWLFNGYQEFSKPAISKTLNAAGYLVLLILFVNTPSHAVRVPLIFIAGTVIGMITLWMFTMNRKPFKQPIRGITTFKNLLMHGAKVGVGGFFAQTVQLLPPVLIGIFLTFSETGAYGAAFKIVLGALIIDKMFVNLYLPSLAKSWSRNPDEAKRKVLKAFNIMMYSGFALTLTIAGMSAIIIYAIYGEEFALAHPILRYLSFFVGATFLNSLFAFGLIAMGKDQDYLKATVRGGIFASVCILAGALTQNIFIVATSVTISEIGIMLFAYFSFKKHMDISLLKNMIVSFTIALACFAFILFSGFNYWLTTLIALTVFTCIMMLEQQLSNANLNWLKNKFNE